MLEEVIVQVEEQISRHKKALEILGAPSRNVKKEMESRISELHWVLSLLKKEVK